MKGLEYTQTTQAFTTLPMINSAVYKEGIATRVWQVVHLPH